MNAHLHLSADRIYPFVARYFTKGILIGAVKG